MNYSLCILDQNDVIADFWFQEYFIDIWSAKMTVPPMRFRSYVDKGTRYASRKKLTSIIKANRHHLGCSNKTDLNYCCHKFGEVFHGALSWIRSNYNEATGLEVLGQQYHPTISVWQFLRPDLKNLAVLNARLNSDDDPDLVLEWDLKRRQRKSTLLREFENELKQFVNDAAIKVRDPLELEELLAVASGGMWRAMELLEDRRWEQGVRLADCDYESE
jgi:hypothetical protein